MEHLSVLYLLCLSHLLLLRVVQGPVIEWLQHPVVALSASKIMILREPLLEASELVVTDVQDSRENRPLDALSQRRGRQ